MLIDEPPARALPRGRHRAARRLDRPRTAHHPQDEPRLRAFPRLAVGGVPLVSVSSPAASTSEQAALSAASPSDGLVTPRSLRGSEGIVVGHGMYIAGPPERRSRLRRSLTPARAMVSPPSCSPPISLSPRRRGHRDVARRPSGRSNRRITQYCNSSWPSARASGAESNRSSPTSMSRDARGSASEAPTRRRRRGGNRPRPHATTSVAVIGASRRPERAVRERVKPHDLLSDATRMSAAFINKKA